MEKTAAQLRQMADELDQAADRLILELPSPEDTVPRPWSRRRLKMVRHGTVCGRFREASKARVPDLRLSGLLQGSLNLTWNPFASGTCAPRRAALQAEQEALRADLSELERTIALEVHRAILDLYIARETAKVRDRGVELAMETLRVERERHSAGRITTNDLLTAEATLRQQRTVSGLARIDILRAWAQLDLAAGRVPFASPLEAGSGGSPP